MSTKSFVTFSAFLLCLVVCCVLLFESARGVMFCYVLLCVMFRYACYLCPVMFCWVAVLCLLCVLRFTLLCVVMFGCCYVSLCLLFMGRYVLLLLLRYVMLRGA